MGRRNNLDGPSVSGPPGTAQLDLDWRWRLGAPPLQRAVPSNPRAETHPHLTRIVTHPSLLARGSDRRWRLLEPVASGRALRLLPKQCFAGLIPGYRVVKRQWREARTAESEDDESGKRRRQRGLDGSGGRGDRDVGVVGADRARICHGSERKGPGRSR